MKTHGTIRRKSSICLGVLVLLTIVSSPGCNDGSGFFPGASDFQFGAIMVRAFDQQNSPVAGATMELRDNRGNLLWGDLNKTGADGSESFTALTPGFYTVTIKPPPGYSVPASQWNPIGADVRNAQFTSIRVFLFAG